MMEIKLRIKEKYSSIKTIYSILGMNLNKL